MKTLTMALLAGAIIAAPIAASAQTHGGGGGGHAGGGGGFRGGGGGFRGGGYRGGGYRGGGYGYRGGYGYGGWGWGLGGFGLGLALGSAYYDPWYYGYGYYPGYYGYPGDYGYAPDAWDDNYDAPPPPSYPNRAAPSASYGSPAPTASAQACGQWVWHADQNKYQWAPGACT